MDDATRAYLEAMEARLMARINDNQEMFIDRMRLNDTTVAGLTRAVSELTDIARGTSNTLASMTELLATIARGQADPGRRTTAPEKSQPPKIDQPGGNGTDASEPCDPER
jgi:hypothetical protein